MTREIDHNAAAFLWNKGLDTAAIAEAMRTTEATIWNWIGLIRDAAAKLRRSA